MTSNVLLVVICRQAVAYRNRRVLRALYAERFDDLAFALGAESAPDPDYWNILSNWRPRLADNLCACCDPARGRHPAGVHCNQMLLVAAANAAEGYEFILFTEDDCLLSPRLDAGWVRQRCARVEALVPWIALRERDDASWVWTQHPTGYPAFDAVASRFDRERLLRHWEDYSRTPAPPLLYTPMISGYRDWLALRIDLLHRMVPDLEALADVWHEAAIPTALVH
jgi:hypothetical protein